MQKFEMRCLSKTFYFSNTQILNVSNKGMVVLHKLPGNHLEFENSLRIIHPNHSNRSLYRAGFLKLGVVIRLREPSYPVTASCNQTRQPNDTLLTLPCGPTVSSSELAIFPTRRLTAAPGCQRETVFDAASGRSLPSTSNGHTPA
jgi:hypothetical protein